MGTICGSSNDAPITIDKKTSSSLKSKTSTKKVTDAEAWAQVNKLWAQKKLKKTDAMSF